MKRKAPQILSIVFLLLFNSSYYWLGKLDAWYFPVIGLMAIFFLSICILFVVQLINLIRTKKEVYERSMQLSILSAAIFLTCAFPNGIVDFHSLEGKIMLTAIEEKTPSCVTILQLREGNRYKISKACEGYSETSGEYTIAGDTLFFKGVNPVTNNKSNEYAFAVVNHKLKEIICFKNYRDKINLKLHIINLIKAMK